MKLFGSKKKTQNKLDAVLKGSDIPSFPKVTMRLLQVIRDPEASIQVVAESLQWDPGLVLRVLKTVNSAVYSPAQPIKDVGHAVNYIGRGQLEQLVLAIAVKGSLPKESAPGFEPARFWQTAAFRAALARRLADRLHPVSQSECFTIGLLQDMAIPVLAHARPQEYGEVLQTWQHESGQSLDALEQGAFGWTHAQVGGWLGTEWELPAEMSDSINGHHEQVQEQQLPAVHLVSMLRETKTEHGIQALIEEARGNYGLQEDWVVTAIAESEVQATELATVLR